MNKILEPKFYIWTQPEKANQLCPFSIKLFSDIHIGFAARNTFSEYFNSPQVRMLFRLPLFLN
ncbi:MAG TPA: hypothetical protein DCF44_06855 [Chitinophagaceae bacterium]|nr:hypothetical protein [Chitinophagaceae bacterium]